MKKPILLCKSRIVLRIFEPEASIKLFCLPIKTVSYSKGLTVIYENRKYFTNVKTTECYVNFDFKIYGEPDLIADDYIIDIKTSENNKIVSKENIKQILFYAIVAGKKNICLYDPINGNLYEYNLTDDDINNAKKFINGDYKPKEIIDNYIV